jgi:hypothetical protein
MDCSALPQVQHAVMPLLRRKHIVSVRYEHMIYFAANTSHLHLLLRRRKHNMP